jgi:hypothetical protein
LAVHSLPDSTLQLGAGEMGAALRCSVVGHPRGSRDGRTAHVHSGAVVPPIHLLLKMARPLLERRLPGGGELEELIHLHAKASAGIRLPDRTRYTIDRKCVADRVESGSLHAYAHGNLQVHLGRPSASVPTLRRVLHVRPLTQVSRGSFASDRTRGLVEPAGLLAGSRVPESA